MKVLMVDDDANVSHLLYIALLGAGCSITTKAENMVKFIKPTQTRPLAKLLKNLADYIDEFEVQNKKSVFCLTVDKMFHYLQTCFVRTSRVNLY